MRLIVDANVIFSALLKNGRTRKLLLDDRLTLYAPLFIKEEVLKYRLYISKETGMDEKELLQFIDKLFGLANIEFIDAKILEDYIKIVKNISPDPKDTIYVAAAVFKGCAIWSNDGPLRKRQNTIKVITTKDLVNLLEKHI